MNLTELLSGSGALRNLRCCEKMLLIFRRLQDRQRLWIHSIDGSGSFHLTAMCTYKLVGPGGCIFWFSWLYSVVSLIKIAIIFCYSIPTSGYDEHCRKRCILYPPKIAGFLTAPIPLCHWWPLSILGYNTDRLIHLFLTQNLTFNGINI